MTGPVVWVTGAGGRIGRALRRAWAGEALHAVWQSRDPAIDTTAGAPRPDVVIALAGVISGPDLGANLRLAESALALGAPRTLVASSAAVYGRAGGYLTEATPLTPAAPYGRAKAEMEAAVRGRATILRIGNVAGADALLGGIRAGQPVHLDQFADGRTPERSYIGPGVLARVLAALARADALPEVLNVAQPGVVEMAALARAAGAEVVFRPAPPEAIARVELDVTRLSALVPLPPAEAGALVADWRETA